MRGGIAVRRRDEPAPVRGLPGPLPEGEEILWQGGTTWSGIARRVCHIWVLACYVALLAAWCGFSLHRSGHPASAAALGAAWIATAGGAAVGMLAVFALLVVRTTTYTITTRRLVVQFGVAMTMTVNVPFRIVEGAALRLHKDGTGDLPLSLAAEQRASYVVLWPHVRPWRLSSPEPMLRSVPEAARVAELLGQALVAAGEAEDAATRHETRPEPALAASPVPEAAPAESWLHEHAPANAPAGAVA